MISSRVDQGAAGPERMLGMSSEHRGHGVDDSPVPGYEIVRSLRPGGMGHVYVARQCALNRLVCLKVMAIPEGEDAELCRTRFCREAELLASVTHPHILSIFDFGATADHGLPYLVTEFIEGGDLRGRMTVDEPLPVVQARSILAQVGDALTYLHGKGILHRDLKPENILMPTQTLVKVGDFGIAVMRDKAGLLTESMRGLGTVGYVSPEQHYGLKVDERTDLYSLAALSYELLTGRRPLGLFAPPSAVNRRLTSELDAVIMRGLAEEPKNRYANVREYMTAFDRALGSIASRTRTRGLKLGACIAAFAAAAVALGTWAIMPHANDNQAAHPAPVPIGNGPPVLKAGEPKPAGGGGVMPPAADRAQPEAIGKPAATAADLSADFKRLVELRAYAIWVAQGRPKGVEGDRARDVNWQKAQRQIEAEVKARAFDIWVRQGRPTGPAGDAVKEKNMRDAQTELLKETDRDLLRHPLD